MNSATAQSASVNDVALDFNALVKKSWRELFRYAYRLSGNPHTAEDLVQESLMRAWRSLHRLENAAAIKGWLYTIVRRENARRLERPRSQASTIPSEEIAAGAKTYDTSPEAFALRRALRALPPEYRDPLLLQVLHGYSQQEIAQRLGLSPAGVGTRLFRARQKLRTALGELG
jgi:RNA polymerase sigma-70 factor (ECF subfamily)